MAERAAQSVVDTTKPKRAEQTELSVKAERGNLFLFGQLVLVPLTWRSYQETKTETEIDLHIRKSPSIPHQSLFHKSVSVWRAAAAQ